MANEVKNYSLNITVDDGFQRVPIINKYGEEIGVFYFNPTDIGIIERYNKLADKFDAITEPMEAVPEDGDPDELEKMQLEALRQSKERLYDAVDELFGGNAAEAFFGKVHPFTPVDGKFYCENVLLTVGEFINTQFDTEASKMSARVQQYTQNRKQRRAKK